MYISYSAARKTVQRSTLQGSSFRSHTGARYRIRQKITPGCAFRICIVAGNSMLLWPLLGLYSIFGGLLLHLCYETTA